MERARRDSEQLDADSRSELAAVQHDVWRVTKCASGNGVKSLGSTVVWTGAGRHDSCTFLLRADRCVWFMKICRDSPPLQARSLSPQPQNFPSTPPHWHHQRRSFVVLSIGMSARIPSRRLGQSGTPVLFPHKLYD